jgi:dolichyl-phosphate-mannose-protein mannosyltransferase
MRASPLCCAPVTKTARVARALGGRDWSRVDTPALLAIAVIGGVLRLWDSGDPRSIVFDETYYAEDACWYAESSKSLCGIGAEENAIHPPLGKWLIAAGIRLFGYDSFGWRISAVVAGTLTIALAYLLARRVLKSTMAASLVSGLLAFDFLHFVQSRIAMLDVFVAMFGTAAFLFISCDKDHSRARDGPESVRTAKTVLQRPWRIAAGLVAGAAAASKWSGIFVVVALILLTVVWEAARRRGQSRALLRALQEEGLSIVLWLIAAPVVLYVLSYAGRLEGPLLSWPWSDGSWVGALWDRQVQMWRDHTSLTQTHYYQSPPWSWPLLKRPVSYYFKTAPNGDYQEILATGNPFVWWTSIGALLYVAYRFVRRPRVAGPEAFILAGFLFMYAPWFVLARDRSAVFIFYMLPALPFMFMALAYIAVRISEWWEGRAAIAIFVATTLGLFVYFYPLMTGRPISYRSWAERMWIFDDEAQCGPPSPSVTSSTVTEIKNGSTIIRTKSAGTAKEKPPPPGWCWV